MAEAKMIAIKPLGQTGFRFDFGGQIIYIDPYLSDYVEKKEGQEFSRLMPVPVKPETIKDADWVLITHAHIDHCDPDTIVPISKASTKCKFAGPENVCEILKELKIEEDRIVVINDKVLEINKDLTIKGVPAAHPEIKRSARGFLECLGYLIKFKDKKLYHSGDTSVDKKIIELLKEENIIDVAFISVNEKNYYRDAMGIIGNMSVREAFQMAEDIGAKVVVPMHWDMFKNNCVYREEIELLFQKINPDFELRIRPDFI